MLGNIIEVLRKLPTNKAPGPDSLTDALLKGYREALAPTLSRIFTTVCLDIGYYLKLFKESITVVLRKPQKLDYSKLGSYRPIAFLNTLAKTIKAIVTKRMPREAEARRPVTKEVDRSLAKEVYNVYI